MISILEKELIGKRPILPFLVFAINMIRRFMCKIYPLTIAQVKISYYIIISNDNHFWKLIWWRVRNLQMHLLLPFTFQIFKWLHILSNILSKVRYFSFEVWSKFHGKNIIIYTWKIVSYLWGKGKRRKWTGYFVI